MQYQEKLLMKKWQKTLSRAQKCFVSFTSTSQTLFQAIIICNLKENQTCENGKKPNFGPNFRPSGPNFHVQYGSADAKVIQHFKLYF